MPITDNEILELSKRIRNGFKTLLTDLNIPKARKDSLYYLLEAAEITGACEIIVRLESSEDRLEDAYLEAMLRMDLSEIDEFEATK